ncbi:MAG TPA: DUF2905 family protein [Rhizomicrobium sp.]
MRWLIYLVIFLAGALLLSQAVAMVGLEPLPGDFNYDKENWHIHIPVLYSLGATAVLGLLIWFFRR